MTHDPDAHGFDRSLLREARWLRDANRQGAQAMAVQTTDKMPVEIRLRPKPVKAKKGKK